MMSELAAAIGDWGFGPTSERWAGGRWTATVILRSNPAACLSSKNFDLPTLRRRRRLRLAFLLFFRSSNRFLRFRYENLRSKNSSFFVSVLLYLKNTHALFNSVLLYLLMLFSCWDIKLVHGFFAFQGNL